MKPSLTHIPNLRSLLDLSETISINSCQCFNKFIRCKKKMRWCLRSSDTRQRTIHNSFLNWNQVFLLRLKQNNNQRMFLVCIFHSFRTYFNGKLVFSPEMKLHTINRGSVETRHFLIAGEWQFPKIVWGIQCVFAPFNGGQDCIAFEAPVIERFL